MKFSEVDEQTWPELTPFDTCLIPFTGLSGMETPEATVALERRGILWIWLKFRLREDWLHILLYNMEILKI